MGVVRDAFRVDLSSRIDAGEYLIRASQLVPLIETSVAEGDRNGFLPLPVLEAMQDAGLLRMLQPSRYGGAECHPATFFDVQTDLSRSDMSTGWLHGVMGVLAFHLALFDVRAQDDVWGDRPNALMASSYMQTGKATCVAGGFRLAGRWKFASGADHADWFLLGGIVVREGETPEPMVFLVPRADVVIHGGWDAMGLKATGSQDVSVADCIVPAYRTHGIRDRFLGRSTGLEVNRAALYRIPLPQMLFRAISSPAIGGLRGLLDALVDYNRDRVAVNGTAAAENPTTQLACAEATAEIDEMSKTLASNFECMLADSRAGTEGTIFDRMIYRLQATMVTERCCRMAARLFKAAGASGLSSAKPFGRFLADIQAARQHAANQYEAHGQALGAKMLGFEMEDSLL